MKLPVRSEIGAAAIAVVMLLAGCGGGPTSASSQNEVSHLRAITALYFRAASSLGKNPTSEAEFKQAIADAKPDLTVLGVDSVDDLFVSDRDGKPLVVLYGSASQGVAPGVIAYEQEGLNGVRLVGSSNGQIQEADAAQFAKLVPSPAPSQ